MDAGLEVTDHETSNAATEAEKSRLSSGKASIDVKQGPGEASQKSAPEQQGAFKRLLSQLPFFGSRAGDEQQKSSADSSHAGLLSE